LKAGEGDALLLEAHALSEAIKAQIIIDSLFGFGEPRELSEVGRLIYAPMLSMAGQCFGVHQERARLGKVRSQAVEHCEPVRIDVPPIVDLPLPQPRDARQQFKGVAKSKNDQSTFYFGKD